MPLSANPVLAGLPTTIFTHMSVLAVAHGAVNLGQGFPDADGPMAIREVAARALTDGPNQYAPMRGRPDLRAAIAAHAATQYGLAYDTEREIIVTCGATEAIVASLMAVARPGAEVVLVEPTYDSYRPMAQAAGLVVKSVVLSPPHWRLTQEALEAAVTDRTAAILINSPQNPIGRVLTRAELEIVARVAVRADAVVICDEAYEHLAYDAPHIPLATLPGMRERTLRIGSAGKNLFPHRLEDWLAHRPRSPDRNLRQGAPVPDLCHSRRVAGGRGAWPGTRDGFSRWPARPIACQSRLPQPWPVAAGLRCAAL
jgi:aspartate/methionine/tyrosine aminotransferase